MPSAGVATSASGPVDDARATSVVQSAFCRRAGATERRARCLSSTLPSSAWLRAPIGQDGEEQNPPDHEIDGDGTDEGRRPKTRTAAATVKAATATIDAIVARKEDDDGLEDRHDRSLRPVRARPACREILRMQEEHGLAVRADPRLAVAEHARAAAPEPVAGAPGCRRPRSRRGGCRRPGFVRGIWRSANSSPSGSRSSILVFGRVTNTTVTPCSAMRCRSRDLGPEHVAVGARGCREIVHGDGDMVETADHAESSKGAPVQTSMTRTWQAGFLPQT